MYNHSKSYTAILSNSEPFIKEYCLKNQDFVLWYLSDIKGNLSRYCVSVLVFNNVFIKDLILEYKPVDFKHLLNLQLTLEWPDFADDYPFLKYPIIRAAVFHTNDCYYSMMDALPEWEVYLAASKTSNKFVYNDQLSKAKKLGFFYRIIDLENECIIDPPQKVEVKELGMSYDYQYYSGAKFGDCGEYKSLESFVPHTQTYDEEHETDEDFDSQVCIAY